MLDNYLNKPRQTICSIESINQEFEKDELLLSNENKNQTIAEQEEDELFELYITPYSEKQVKTLKIKDLSVNQDTTILKGSHREELVYQLKCQQYEQEVRRLKKIILKKNKVIGDLTEQLKAFYQQPKRSVRNKKSLYACSSQQFQSSKHSKQNQCENTKCKNQLIFFQKNNLQLYDQLLSCKAKSEDTQLKFQKANQDLKKYTEIMDKIQAQNKALRNQNMSLLKSTKKYLNQGAKQIKIMNKMRQVLAEKLSLKQMNIQIPEFSAKVSLAASKIKSERKEVQSRRVSQRYEIERYSKSLEKHGIVDKPKKQRSFSQNMRKIKN